MWQEEQSYEEQSYQDKYAAASPDGLSSFRDTIVRYESLFISLTLVDILESVASALLQCMTKDSDPNCSYEHPWADLLYPLLWNWRDFVPKRDQFTGFRAKTKKLRNEHQSCIAVEALRRGPQVELLRYLTRGAYYIEEKGTRTLKLSEALRQEIQHQILLTDWPQDKVPSLEQYYEQYTRPFIVGRWPASGEYPETLWKVSISDEPSVVLPATFIWRCRGQIDYQCGLFVQISPPVIPSRENVAFFRIRTGLAAWLPGFRKSLSDIVDKETPMVLAASWREDPDFLSDEIYNSLSEFGGELVNALSPLYPPDYTGKHDMIMTLLDMEREKRISLENRLCKSQCGLSDDERVRQRIHGLFPDTQRDYKISEIALRLGVQKSRVRKAYERCRKDENLKEKWSLEVKRDFDRQRRPLRLPRSFAIDVAVEAVKRRMDKVESLN